MRLIVTQCLVCQGRTKWMVYADGRIQCTECLSTVDRSLGTLQLALFKPQIVKKDVKKDVKKGSQ